MAGPPFEIIRHPHFVVVKNLYSGVGGNRDVSTDDLFRGHEKHGVKVKRISFIGGAVKNYIKVKQENDAGPEICRLGKESIGVPESCYFKNGGSVMRPFIDVSDCSLNMWAINRIIFDFDN